MKIEAFHYLPKPLDDLMIYTVAIFVLCVFSPVIHIDISQATHQKLHNKKCQTVDMKNNGNRSPVLRYEQYFLPLVRFHQKFWWDPVVSVQKIPSRKNIFKILVSGVNGQSHTSSSSTIHSWALNWHFSVGKKVYMSVLSLIPQSGYFKTSPQFLSLLLLHVTPSLQQIISTWERK